MSANNQQLELHYSKCHPDAIEPTYATDGAACFDLYSTDTGAVIDGVVPHAVFGTGLCFEVPPGYVMLIYSRSGHGFKSKVRLANATGVIDSDYRGEVRVALSADSGGHLHVNKGDRIAQALLLPIPAVRLQPVDSLSQTKRGTGGFGSTGQ